MVAKCGIKILGHVNVLSLLYGMDIFVFQILVQKEEFGMRSTNHVNVQMIKFGKIKPVSLQKSHVIMVKFGIKVSMHVYVLLILFHRLIVVIKFHIVKIIKDIILVIINVNVHLD